MVQDEKHAHNASVPVITTPLWSLLMLPMVLSSTPDHDWGYATPNDQCDEYPPFAS
jgi:hypothetical protein